MLYDKDYNDKWDKIIISVRCMAVGLRAKNTVIKEINNVYLTPSR